MNPKIFLIMGFLMLGMVITILAAEIPQGLVYDIFKLLLLCVGMFCIVLGFSARYYTYLILPLFRQRHKNIILSDQVPYWLASTGDAIVTKVGTDFVATTYINIPIYVSASEMGDDERERFANQISRLVGVSTEPVRFTTELRIMDKDNYLKKIKEIIAASENDEILLKEGPDVDLSAQGRARGKLAMWKKVLDHIGSKNSRELVTFATVSAMGTKEYEAITLAQQKAKELMNGIGTILGVTPNVIVGSEVLTLVEPEYLIPLSTISEEITKKIEHGEVE